MARKVAAKVIVPVETVETVIDGVEEMVTDIVEEKVQEVPIVTSLKIFGYLTLDEKNEIRIEQSSNYWVHAYWTDGDVSVWVASFEINHSTTNDDIIKSVKRYVRDRFTFLAERTFVAQQNTNK